MAGSITIRDVPDDARAELAARAARSGRSLQEYLRGQMIELARKPDTESLMERIRSRKARTGTELSPARILKHRDDERR